MTSYVPGGSSNGSYGLGPVPGLPNVNYRAGDLNTLWDNLVNGVKGQGALGVDGAAKIVSELAGKTINALSAKSELAKLFSTYAPTANSSLSAAMKASNAQPASSGGTASSGGISLTQQAQQSAYATVYSTLQNWGLTDLAGWAYDQITTPGDMKGATTIVDMIRGTPEYAAAFPGNVQLIAAGKPPLDESTYKSVTSAYQGIAQQYGLPAGFLNQRNLDGTTTMGNLIANNVSSSEFQARVQNGYTVAKNADPNTKALLNQYYGINDGNLAAYYLDPTKGLDALQKQTQTAVIGGISKDTGFGDIGQSTAEQLAAQQVGSGGSMDANYFRTQFSKIAPLVPLEQAQIGQRGQAVASQQALLGQAFTGLNQTQGTTAAGDQASVVLAEEARKAGLSGGGGFAQTARGGVGVGQTSTEGTGK